jgi:hypothetical protein
MLLIFQDPEAFAKVPADVANAMHAEYGVYTQALIDAKEFVNGDPLQGNDTATTVRVKNGDRLVTDGPFLETKEWLAGYYTIDVPDLDRALELAAQIPNAVHGLGPIEVRPIMEMG